MSPDVLLQYLEVNPTDDWQGDVPHGYSARSATVECSEMSMSVNNEIRRSPVQDNSQLAVSEHPILAKRLPTEGRRGRSEVDDRDAHVRVQRIQRLLESLALTAGTNGKSFQGPRMNRVRPLVRPESATTAGRSGDANARPVRQANDGGAAVKHLDPAMLEHAPERHPAQRPQVVVAEHRDNGQPAGCQQLTSHLGFQQATVLREIPGDKQQIGLVREAGKTGDRMEVFSTTDMKVANRRDPDLQQL